MKKKKNYKKNIVHIIVYNVVPSILTLKLVIGNEEAMKGVQSQKLLGLGEETVPVARTAQEL